MIDRLTSMFSKEWYKTRKQESESGESIREEEEESVLMPGEVSAPGDYHISLIATVKRHSSCRLVWLANEFTPRIKYSASCWHHHLSVRIQLYEPAAMFVYAAFVCLLGCHFRSQRWSWGCARWSLDTSKRMSSEHQHKCEPNTALDGWPCQVGLV